jgi:hypothetical protein
MLAKENLKVGERTMENERERGSFMLFHPGHDDPSIVPFSLSLLTHPCCLSDGSQSLPMARDDRETRSTAKR